MQLEQLTAGRGALTAVRTGEGRDLVVLHSLLADRHAFDPVLPALSAKNRVTLFNLPGFHGSQPAMLALMDAYLAVIEDGFEEFGIGKDSVLVGNGFGGTVALAFALAHPERISKLVLSDAAAGFPPLGREAFAVMAEKVADGGLGSIAEIAAKRVFSPAYLAAHPEKIEERKKVLLDIDPKAFQAACKIMQETNLVPVLHQIKVTSDNFRKGCFRGNGNHVSVRARAGRDILVVMSHGGFFDAFIQTDRGSARGAGPDASARICTGIDHRDRSRRLWRRPSRCHRGSFQPRAD